MTLIVLVKQQDKYLLAADGRACANSTVLQENISKIIKFKDYLIAVAGDPAGTYIIKNILNNISIDDDLEIKIYNKVHNLDIGIDFTGLIIRRNENKEIKDILQFGTHENRLHINNLTDQNNELETIGSGSDIFLAAYKTLEKIRGLDWTERDLDTVYRDLALAADVAADLDVFCNGNLTIYEI